MTTHYTATAKGLHWLMAILLFALLALGFYMQDLPLSPQKLRLYSWHKWAGVTAFLLAGLRLLWRATHRPPAPHDSLPKIVQRASRSGHLTLYLLMIAIPLSGWLMSSAKGFQTVWFGLLPIPDLVGKDREWGDLLAIVHRSLALLFVALVAGHVAAALKHHIFDRSDILRRMSILHRPEN